MSSEAAATPGEDAEMTDTPATTGEAAPPAEASSDAMETTNAAESEAAPPSMSILRDTLNGCWSLDKSRGEWSMRHYLEVMGVNELAIKAHEKGESEFETYHTIDLTVESQEDAPQGRVKIVKRSRVNADLVVDVPLGQEQIEYLPPGDREKKILAISDNDGKHLKITSSLHTMNGLALVVDEKQLVQPGEDPNAANNSSSMIQQTLTITNHQTGQSHTTTRYFVPYDKTPPHLE